MKPTVKILDLTKESDRQEFVEAVTDGFGIVHNIVNEKHMLVTVAKMPERKIQTAELKK